MDFSSDLIMMSQSLTNISDVINDVVGAVLRTNLDHNASFFNQASDYKVLLKLRSKISY